MKKLLSLITFLTIISNVMAQEIPNGFNYQAVIRDAAGNIISNEGITLKLSILDNLDADIWTETHNVTTNQFGLVSLFVGQGTQIGGTAASFGDIDWSVGAMKLRTVVTYNSQEIDMGSSNIWAVPYSLISGEAFTADTASYSTEAGNALTADEALYAEEAGTTEYAVNAQNATNAQNAVIAQTATNALTADVAYDLNGDLSRLNVIEDVEGAGIEPLFEVKNNTGQTVFAVYNEGVEVYFDDSNPKGIKGSFAVRGFGNTKEGEQDYLFVNRDSARIYLNSDTTSKGIKGSFAVGSFYTPGMKAPSNEYLRITEDSSRIYINDTPESIKGIKGSFAVQGFKNIDKGEGNNYFDINMDQTSAIVNPSQNRILWYPYSNAFLAGRVLIEDASNVGENSFVAGYESRAKGDYSQAMGYQAYADGLNSTSIGQNSLAGGANSYAIGQDAEVLAASGYSIGMNASVGTAGTYGYAMGHNASSTARSSYAIGENSLASGEESYAIGRGAIANGIGSFAFGSAGLDSLENPTEFVQAIGNHSVAIGQGAKATSEGSVAIGVGNTASNMFSTALGYKNLASGFGSLATGYETTAIGAFSTATGNRTTASGFISTANGRETIASGMASTAMGNSSRAWGDYSTAMGWGTTASGYNSTAMGDRTIALGSTSTAMGYMTQATANFSTAFGQESIASGGLSIATGYQTIASGSVSMAMGLRVKALSYGEIVLGFNNSDYSPSSVNSFNYNDRLFVIGNGTSTATKSDALVILKNGSIGMGTSTPSVENKLHVIGTTTAINNRSIYTQASGGTNNYGVSAVATGGTYAYSFYGLSSGATINLGIRAESSGAAQTNYGIFATASGATTNYAGYFSGNVTVTGTFSNPSDVRYKTNIENIENSVDKIMLINGIRYNWRIDEFPEMNFDHATHLGVLAQEVEEVLPELVYTDENGYKSVSYEKLTPVLIEAIKEQQEEIATLKARLEAIETMLDI